MEHWAMQYINYVEITKPDTLRQKIKITIEKSFEKYNNKNG
jgi:predicted DNA-binding transcriptional regulator YafY